MASTFAPTWLDPADVKSWLRLQQQDTSDDQLVQQVAAMAEPYVERCRPEWRVLVVPAALIRLDVRSGTGAVVVAVEEWQTETPAGVPITNGRGHVIQLWRDPTDDWGTITPSAQATAIALDPAGVQQSGPVTDAAGGAVSAGQAVTWASQAQLLVFTYGAPAQPGDPASFTLDNRLHTYQPDAETYQGAVMYAAREYRRRNRPAGVEMFGDVSSFVSRYDPDIDRALQTGAYARPVVS
jgi:hypothetical protein